MFFFHLRHVLQLQKDQKVEMYPQPSKFLGCEARAARLMVNAVLLLDKNEKSTEDF